MPKSLVRRKRGGRPSKEKRGTGRELPGIREAAEPVGEGKHFSRRKCASATVERRARDENRQEENMEHPKKFSQLKRKRNASRGGGTTEIAEENPSLRKT